MLWVSERGTQHYSRDALRRSRSPTLAARSSSSRSRTGRCSASAAFARRSTRTWAIFADRLMRPTLDSADVELVRAQLLSARAAGGKIARRAGRVSRRQRRVHGPPVRARAERHRAVDRRASRPPTCGTTATQQLVTSRMLLVVVGNVDARAGEARRAAHARHAAARRYAWTAVRPHGGPAGDPTPGARAGAVIEQRRCPRTTSSATTPGPPATSPDYQALRVATAVLSGRLFTEIRVAPQSDVRGRRAVHRARDRGRRALRDHRRTRHALASCASEMNELQQGRRHGHLDVSSRSSSPSTS